MKEKNEKIINGYVDLEVGLTENELQRALARKGEEVLQSELAIIIGAQFKVYDYLLSCLEASRNSSSKRPVEFPGIESAELRARLEHAVVLFGARRVYIALETQYEKSRRGVVRRHLENVLPQIPLAEVKSILHEIPATTKGKLKFNYKK